MSAMTDKAHSALPQADAVLEAAGETCATLTPAIRAKMRDLGAGQILEVVSDEPAAREGVPAWSRLTGNPLLATAYEDSQRTRFYLRKKG
jgi:tRNA 2-thiouridine synthesizing protein A